MTQNMFLEGLYQVFLREHPLHRVDPVTTNSAEPKEIRLIRWFGTVVNTRLLIIGVVQVLAALHCILSTVSFVCVIHSCSVSLTTPVWSGLFYMGTGGLAMEVQRKPNKVKVITLMGLNVFCLLLGICSVITFSLSPALPATLTTQQRSGAYVMKSSCIVVLLQCVLASVYTLFLIWRGLRRYSISSRQDYSQDVNEHTHPLLETERYTL